MDWAHAYYTRQSETFGRAVVTEHNRRTAERIDDWASALGVTTDLLELGAGAGGLAAALADLGRRVVTVEFNPSDAAFARTLAAERNPGAVTVIEDDFYTVDLPSRFDFIYYWDGFGIGTDEDQRRLLRRVARDWLTADGRFLLDVFSPWNWQRRHGETSLRTARDGSTWVHTVRFDAVGSRLVDSWHPEHEADHARGQTIRCYSIPELVMLAEGTGLRVDRVCAMDGSEIDPGRDSEAMSARLMETNGYFAFLAADR